MAVPAHAEGRALTPHVLMVAGILLTAGYFVLGRAVHAEIPSLALIFWRSVAAVALVGLVLWRRVRAQAPTLLRAWKVILFLGVVHGVTGHALVLKGLETTTAINTGLITTLQPALTSAVAVAVLRDRLAPWQLAGLGVALIGALVVLGRGDPATLADLSFVAGDLWVLAAMVSFSFYNVFLKRTPAVDPFVLCFGILAASTLVLAPLYAGALLMGKERMPVDATSIATVLYMAVFGTLLAMAFVAVGIQRLGPPRAAVYFYLMPVVTALLAVPLLGEALRAYHFAGLVIVIGGIALVNRRRPAPVR